MKLDLRGLEWPVDVLGADGAERVSERVRGEYMHLITRLGRDRQHDPDWWVTSLAARNTYVCPLYFRLCQLILVHELCRQRQPPEEVLTDSAAMAEIIKRLPGAPRRVRLIDPKSRFSRWFGFVRRYAASLYHVLGQALCAPIWLKKNPLPENGTILLDLFLSSANLSGGAVEDRYYPGLLEALDQKDRSKIVYAPIHYKVKNYPAFYQRVNACRERLLLQEEVLTPGDYLYALLHPLRLRWPARQIEFFGIEVGELVREALAENIANSSSIAGLLRYRFARRLKKLDFGPGGIIEWFENQEVDHGAVAGWRRYFPETEVVGYQGFLSSQHYLSAFPLEQELAYELLPTRMVVIGDNMVERAKEFAPNLRVETGPAFRFAAVWLESPRERSPANFNLLIALPIHYGESRNIVELLFQAVANTKREGDIAISIKPHPTWAAADVDRLVSGANKGYRLVAGSFDDALANADLVVTAASSVGVFAVARGVPCLIVGLPGQLLQNPINADADAGLWKACYSAQQLAEAIDYYAELPAQEKVRLRDAANLYRDRQFTRVTRDSVYEFVGLPAAQPEIPGS